MNLDGGESNSSSGSYNDPKLAQLSLTIATILCVAIYWAFAHCVPLLNAAQRGRAERRRALDALRARRDLRQEIEEDSGKGKESKVLAQSSEPKDDISPKNNQRYGLKFDRSRANDVNRTDEIRPTPKAEGNVSEASSKNRVSETSEDLKCIRNNALEIDPQKRFRLLPRKNNVRKDLAKEASNAIASRSEIIASNKAVRSGGVDNDSIRLLIEEQDREFEACARRDALARAGTGGAQQSEGGEVQSVVILPNI
jgi:hypothetical protein